MITMTFDEYDALVASFTRINRSKQTYWPTPEEIAYMEQNPSRFVIYLAFRDETNEAPISQEEKYSQKNIRKFLRDHLNLVDSKDMKK